MGNERYNTGETVRICIPPYPFCVLFQIHGSKFKLHPVRYLSQACVSSISQTMLLFCIRKDTLNRLFPSLVHPLVNRSVTGIVGQCFVVFPDVSGNCAIMDIARGNLYCQNDTVNIAGGMCFIGQLLLVVALDKQPAVWVGSAFYNCFCLLCFLFAFFSFFLEVLSRFFWGETGGSRFRL